MKPKIVYAIAGLMVLLLSSPVPAWAQGGKIKGKVKDARGKALEGVAVRAANADNKQEARETKTDGKGEFEIGGLAGGGYVLTFERQGFRAFVTRRLEVAGGETLKLRGAVELTRDRPPYALIRGAVFNSDGFSLPNAKLTIERIGEGKRHKDETASGEGGEFAFRLPAEKGTYRVTATARGFEPASKEVTVDGDEVQQVAFTLERAK